MQCVFFLAQASAQYFPAIDRIINAFNKITTKIAAQNLQKIS